MEKMLFEIAIERILGRLSRAKKDDQNEVILILNEAMKNEIHNHGPARSNAAEKLVRILFPELRQEAR